MLQDLKNKYDFCYGDIKDDNFFIIIDDLLLSSKTLPDLLEEIKYQFEDISEIQEETQIYEWFYYYTDKEYTHKLPQYLEGIVQFIGVRRLFNLFLKGEFECLIDYRNFKTETVKEKEDYRMTKVNIYIYNELAKFSSVNEMVEYIESVYGITGVRNWTKKKIPFKYSHIFSFEKKI